MVILTSRTEVPSADFTAPVTALAAELTMDMGELSFKSVEETAWLAAFFFVSLIMLSGTYKPSNPSLS